MAIFGAAYLCWAKISAETTTALPTYDTGLNLGALNEANSAVSFATGKVWGDNRAVIQRTDFTGGTVDVKADDFSLAAQAALLGAAIVGDELGFGPSDNAPFGGLAYYVNLQERDTGTVYYETHYFPKVVAHRQNSAAQTQADSVAYQIPALQFELYKPKFGKYEYVERHATEAAAIAYIDGKLGVADWFTVKIAKSGTGTVSPYGTVPVASGDDLVITITGTPDALYDDGTESKVSIVGGVYTVTDVAADHEIVVAF